MRTTWSLEEMHRINALANRIGHVNTAIFEMAQVRDQLDGERMRAVATMLGMEGKTLLEGHWQCHSSPTGHCLFEIVATTITTNDETCLFCGQSLTR
jgi:hypothetical protein